MNRFPGQKFVFLLSIMADKDVDEMLALLLPLAGQFVTVAAHTPRAMPAETLAEQIRARGGRAEPAPTIEAGVAAGHALLLRRCAGSVCKIEPVKKRGCGTREKPVQQPPFCGLAYKKMPRCFVMHRTAGQYHLWGGNVLRRCASAQALPAQPNSSIFSLHLSMMA